MARLFDFVSSEYLTYGTAIVTAYPFAASVWFNSDADDQNQCILGFSDTVGNANEWRLVAGGEIANDPIRFRSRDATNKDADTSSGYTVNTWHLASVIALSATERHVYIDGGGKGSNTTSSTPAGLDNTNVGAQVRDTVINFMSGQIGEVAIWDLTGWGGNDAVRELAFEKAQLSLAKGYSPLCFPLGLLAYWDLVRGLNDRINGQNMTIGAGTVASAHPRIIYPSSQLIKTFIVKEELIDEGDDALHRSQLGSDFRRERQLTNDGRM